MSYRALFENSKNARTLDNGYLLYLEISSIARVEPIIDRCNMQLV